MRRRLDLARISLSLVLVSQLLAPEEWSVRADLSGTRVWLAAGRLAAGVTWHASSRLAGHSPVIPPGVTRPYRSALAGRPPRPDLTCKDSTGQYAVDDPRLSCTCCHARSARGSAERLGLREGSAVTVVIKSTDVLVATDRA